MKLLILLSLYFKTARTNKVFSDVCEEKVNCLASKKKNKVLGKVEIIYEFSCKRNLHWWKKQSGIEWKGSTRKIKDSHDSITRRETGLQKTDKSLQRSKTRCKWIAGVTERGLAFECKRKRVLWSLDFQPGEECAASSEAEETAMVRLWATTSKASNSI